jgi:hypothetical protein
MEMNLFLSPIFRITSLEEKPPQTWTKIIPFLSKGLGEKTQETVIDIAVQS